MAIVGHKKADLLIKGQSAILKKLKHSEKSSLEGCIWFHCASLGEFEQARPLIESFRKNDVHSKILLSFFSPSGYEIRKNYNMVDEVIYLPFDIRSNVNLFLNYYNPSKVFFVKYEFWPNYMASIHKKNIPFYLIAGVFRKEQLFFKWYGSYFKNKLKGFTYFFVQDYPSKELLESIHLNNVLVTGDTRYDRVIETRKNCTPLLKIEQFKNNHLLMVIGSAWSEDLNTLSDVFAQMHTKMKFIIAPHEIDATKIQRLQYSLPCKSIRYSELQESIDDDIPILIIDNIGMLSMLYQYANISYVGGAFGKGLHNILEPAVFGCPIVFGPQIEKFNEAKSFISLGVAFSILTNQETLEIIEKLYNDSSLRACIKKRLTHAMEASTGATQKIISYFETEKI
jgi:3-deoxy-D-manno-octulosonic-acid transferase